ncbi:MAG: hypothetical protein EP314_00930, partial [Bacteroidetes bacterium]
HLESNRTFVAHRKGVLELARSDSGHYIMRELNGLNASHPVQQILAVGNNIFFVGETDIHQIDPNNTETPRSYSFPEKLITGAFCAEDNLFILILNEGLFRWDDGRTTKIGDHSGISQQQVLCAFETEQGTLVGFDNDRLLRFKNDKFVNVWPELQSFLTDNILSDAVLLADSLVAVSTLAGGAAIYNWKKQEFLFKFDYASGIADNEVFCLGVDRHDGLWMAFEEVLTRVDINQPIVNYSGYPGLDGNLTSSLYAKGELFVGTGTGVYVLKPATDKAELDRMMDQMLKNRMQSEETSTAENDIEGQQNRQSANDSDDDLIERFMDNPAEVRQELSRKELKELKREIRKQRKEERKGKSAGELIEEFFTGAETENQLNEQESDESAVESVDPRSAGNGATTEQADGEKSPSQLQPTRSGTQVTDSDQRKIDRFRNSFLFRKVKGIEVKCRQLIEFGDRIFAATNSGLFLIQDGSATNLTPGVYINHVAVTQNGQSLLIAATDGIHELKSANGKWVSKQLNDSIRFVAYNVLQDKNGIIWAGSDNGVYRFQDKGNSRMYRIPDAVNERVLAVELESGIHFLLPSSVYRYNTGTDGLVRTQFPEIDNAEQIDFFLGNKNIVWLLSNLGWSVLPESVNKELVPYLHLFQDVRHLSIDSQGNIYVIDRGKNVYSIRNSGQTSSSKFNIYIRNIQDDNGQSFSLDQVKIQTDGNALVFTVSAPFYLKDEGTMYQFRIEGPYNNWSQWLDEPEIRPGIIPPGDYVLEVRAKNILGQVSETRQLQFSVPKPWYSRWYAILVYVIALTLILLAIIKMRERSLKETQRILEAKVAERTAELEQEKVKTEELLLNILPKDTAAELQKNGKATARHYNQVSVLFTDFKGFTQFAETTKPEDLVSELHRYFVKFDEIIGKYYLEKIKTIGDAYMCAGGVPIRNNSNAIAITLAALEIRDFMAEVGAEKATKNEQALEIRVGIHTGPLTAGVVGLKKFAYDIWGDTVNTASRMESASEPGQVNVSGATHELIKKYFECEYRGKKEVKGKGAVDMYFVHRIRPEFSENSNGIIPNKELLELIG